MDDLKDVSSGATAFASQFKPSNIKGQNAKTLLIDDHDYSTPQDHYFSYLNKSKTGGENKEQEVL